MNHFKRVSNRVPWYELKRLQSSLSVSNSKIQIPARIKREPTDILSAMDATIPDVPQLLYRYRDDPFLAPMRKRDYRLYMLAYEAGQNAAKWVHDEHRELFPQHLSEPVVEEFKPPRKYTEKSQVSEEILSNLISRRRIPDAIHVYRLLEGEVSNDAKQMLLELLCFSGGSDSLLPNDVSCERWYYNEKKPVKAWTANDTRTELYNFLIKQDAATEAAAHNVMICGLTRFLRDTEAWALYEQCKENDIPLNITTYNCVLTLLSSTYYKNDPKGIPLMYGILKSINERGLKPNVRTMNAALKVITAVSKEPDVEMMESLVAEFKRIGVECSLASYYYLMLAVQTNGDFSFLLPGANDKRRIDHSFWLLEIALDAITLDAKFLTYFERVLKKVPVKSYKIEDPDDGKFFPHAMFIAQLFSNKWIGDWVHKILLTGDNSKFLSNITMADAYYSWHMVLVLSTSGIDEFFKLYARYVPSVLAPRKRVYKYMINRLQLQDPKAVVKYIAKLWQDVETLNYSDLQLKLSIIRLMKVDLLPADSPLRADFAKAAWNCWNDIKKSQEEYSGNAPIESSTTASLAMTMLRVGRVKEAEIILAAIAKELDFFVPTTTKQQLDELFEACLAERSAAGALSVLEYSMNTGFPHIAEMARKLNNQLELTNDDRDKLINLVGVDELRAPSASESS